MTAHLTPARQAPRVRGRHERRLAERGRRSPSIAIVHDYLNQRGGAERVVLELARMWPEADLYTSIFRRDSTFPEFSEREVHTSYLDRLPVNGAFRSLLPLYPSAFSRLGPLEHDVVISSSSAWAHGIPTGPRSRHIVYCHTPARWLYSPPGQYLGARSWREHLARPLTPRLRRWDQRAASRPALYIANSRHVEARIRELYGRDAVVIHPPVDTDRMTPKPRGERLLVVSRLLDYKRVDTVVRAATQAALPLDVVGTGPSLKALRACAGPSVAFHGNVDDAAVTQMMEACRALVVPGAEDFGITAVEAQAAGKPVIALAAGGALETVEPGVTGVFFSDHRTQTILRAIEDCDAITTSPEEIARHAERFSRRQFARNMRRLVRGGVDRRRTVREWPPTGERRVGPSDRRRTLAASA